MVPSTSERARGQVLAIEPNLHEPIIQDMVLLSDSAAARAFWQWIQDNPEAQAIIQQAGYTLPARAP